MLRELHISNLAVIEDVVVEFGEGLNCITGQTGAGKSLILGAFEILLALRGGGGADLIRPGAEDARVSGLFELGDPWIHEQVSSALDMPLEPDEGLLISRKLFASGRSGFSANGRPVTTSMVRSVGELLVDVHGQHDNQYLLKPSNQLLLLDGFARCLDLRQQFSRVYTELRKLIRRRQELGEAGSVRRQQLELYEFQAAEIDAVGISGASEKEGTSLVNELAELQARHQLLSNMRHIKQQATAAYAALHESDGSVVERLQMISQVLLELAEMDEQIEPVAEQVRTATLTLQENAYELGRYMDRLELNREELVEIEDRLDVLNRLISKYAADDKMGDDPIAAVQAYRNQIGQQIQKLRYDNDDLDKIDKRIDAVRAKLRRIGETISKRRRDAAARLTPLIEAELAELNMPEASLVVEFETFDLDLNEEWGPGASGLDRMEMLMRMNPGQPAQPLRRIASGGELSRIMLAIKSVLSQADRISVLVFDEIDANVGGRTGTVIGQKLRKLASVSSKTNAHDGHQVLCITHLPQIAAFADHHLRITKRVEGKGKSRQTTTDVTILNAQTRIDELAEMLAGKQASKTTRRQAKEMLESVISSK